jgi:hypothetical protein
LPTLLSAFTPANLFVAAIQSFVLSGLLRFCLWVFKVTPPRQRWYWIATPAFLFVVVTLFNGARTLATNVRITCDVTDIADVDTTPGGNTIPPTDVSKRVPGLLVELSARNTGEPTIIEGGRLDIELPNGDVLHRFPVAFDDNDKVVMMLSSGQRSFTKDDFFLRKTSVPIPSGSKVEGIITYLMPEGVTREDLLAAKHGTAEFTDITGRSYKVDIPWTNKK